MSTILIILHDVKFNKNAFGFHKFFMNVQGRTGEQERF
jgi:hypothetical protein